MYMCVCMRVRARLCAHTHVHNTRMHVCVVHAGVCACLHPFLCVCVCVCWGGGGGQSAFLLRIWDYTTSAPAPSLGAISNDLNCDCNALYFKGTAFLLIKKTHQLILVH